MVNNVLTSNIHRVVTESDCVGVMGHGASDGEIVTVVQINVLKNNV